MCLSSKTVAASGSRSRLRRSLPRLYVLSRRIVEFCEKCSLLICTSLTRRRITEGEMRARVQSHNITRRRAGRGTARLAVENQTKVG